ncbi:MAG: CDP-alcohol phosphatidyltransferase family protein [Planctomycetes bacterium]|nr:CDP-alcohol phosphatidyltransferase family protein [Planctomycetota bacterium]
MIVKQVPNLITLARLVLAVMAFYYMSAVIELGESGAEQLLVKAAAFSAFWYFFIAAVTDWLDGFLARRNGWVTAIGRVADPVVDKVLILGVMAYLSASNIYYARAGDWHVVMPVWAVVLSLGREFLVTALRGMVEAAGKRFPADVFGKVKMLTQALYVGTALGAYADVPSFVNFPQLVFLREPWFFFSMFWLMITLTVFSGINYCITGARLLSGSLND